MQDLAKHKFPPAEYAIGLWETQGDVLPKDVAGGLARIQWAAGKNYGPALFFVGDAKLQGTLLAKDPEQGLSLMRDAAVLGSRQAQLALGKMYETGDGVESDRYRAERYFRLCAASGTPECELRLGRLLLASGPGRESDRLQAIAWLELAESHKPAAAKDLVEPETAKFTPEQTQLVAPLKDQLEHKQ